MNQTELEAKVKYLETRLTEVQGIQQIEKLQRVYGYYLDNRKWDDVADLFSENTNSLEISDSGVYLEKAGVVRFLKGLLGRGGLPPNSGALGTHMQLQGVVNLDPDGNTAKGRWQCLMLLATPLNNQLTALLGHGVYECEYIKESDIWKFRKMHFYLVFRTPWDQGWVKTPVVHSMAMGTPDQPPTVYKPLPAGYAVPFHFSNPVTNKKTKEVL